MKKFVKFSFITFLLLAVTSCGPKYERVANDPTKTRIYTLENGLKVYMNVNKDEPRIDAQIAVRVGSKNDPHETTGLAHYFEHLMFKGTEQFGTSDYSKEKPLLDEIENLFEIYRQTTDEEERSKIYHKIDSVSYEASKYAIPNEYDKLMAAIGANGTNAYTSSDMTVYVENIPSNELENWAIIQSDRFRNNVIRGFHTELETVYEEKNMSLKNDTRKMYDAMFSSLYKNHPYGTQTTLGTQQHLKNPSITNIKNYYKEWYVPNNMAICLSGDIDPDKAIKVIEKHFGSMEPNKNLKKLEFKPEEPINEPIVKEVYGLESPKVLLAWRLPGANDPEDLTKGILSMVMYNGQAGLMDLNVNQPQRTLGTFAGIYPLTDHSVFCMMGEPKEGQTLEDVKKILLEQVELLKRGEFSDRLIEATINQYKLQQMYNMEYTWNMVDTYVSAFINGREWSDIVHTADNISKITKEDIVAYAQKYFGNNYAEIRKLEGEDPNEVKIDKPKITPIATNRDKSSQFLQNIMASKATPIEPVFVDFEKDMDILTLKEKADIEVLYKKNEINDRFELIYRFDIGSEEDKLLSYAIRYFDYLGTKEMTPAQIQEQFYNMACSYNLICTENDTYALIAGLGENMTKAIELFENVVANAVGDPEVLNNLKSNIITDRENSKQNQYSNFNALSTYGIYGKTNPITTDLSNKEILALSDDLLLSRIHELFSYSHTIMYYGPMDHQEISQTLAEHHNTPSQLRSIEKSRIFKEQITDKNRVLIAPYQSNQLYLGSFSNRGEKYDVDMVPITRLYNAYFGGGMNSIVFQEMREARGLAYSANAWLAMPYTLDENITYNNFIATQNDKLIDALTAFDDIINRMPESENAFNIAKESLITNIRTTRTLKIDILWKYLNAKDLGLNYDISKDVFEKVQGYTLEDVVAFQKKMIKDRKYTIYILGDAKDMDINALKDFGEITHLTTEEIFGY